ncbi:MAG: hypothetical protein JWR40_4150 [Massilia sp.]|jgi:hypothetical protein|nr:hypothetical protein [Massilia sp.]
MALVQRNGVWQWRKMVDGAMINRSTRTDDRKFADQLAKKWEHEAVQQIVYEGERPVTVHEAIKGFLNHRKHMKGSPLEPSWLRQTVRFNAE